MNGPDRQDTLVVSLREYRLVTERLLLLAGFGMGAAPPLREVFVAAQIHSLPALRFLHDSQSAIEDADLSAVRVRTHEESISVDCAGIPSILVSSLLIDLAVDRARHRQNSTISIANVTHREFLPVLPVLGHRHRVAAHVEGVTEAGNHEDVSARCHSRNPVKLVATAGSRSAKYADGLLGQEPVEAEQAALRHGLRVKSNIWWELYRRSILALSPDSPTSRRHAGATLVDADGKVHGEKDPELDLSVYSGDTPPAFDDSLGKEYRDAAS